MAGEVIGAELVEEQGRSLERRHAVAGTGYSSGFGACSECGGSGYLDDVGPEGGG
jgi:hypothetical protein